MKGKILILCLISVLLLFVLSVPGICQQLTSPATPQEDSVDIAISYAMAYPGTETWLEVSMRNPMPVAGYHLTLMVSNPDPGGFCCDDTGGCIVSNYEWVEGCECFGHPSPGVRIWWYGDTHIPPSPDFQTLFRICAAACCLPDTTIDRCATIYMGHATSWVSDPQGQLMPIRYHQGELCLWWSVPGDANGDSVVTSADLVFLINYLYRFEGIEPCVCEAADCNGDCTINSGDIVYLIGYLFRSGPVPVPGCAHCPHEDCWPE